MAYIPRWYQQEAHDATYQFFAENKTGNPLICMPTGTGKSWSIALFIESVIKRWPNQTVVMMTHVAELIKQNASKLRELWPTAPLGIFSSQLDSKVAGMPITYGGVKSIANSISLFKVPDLVLIDEAHLVSQNDQTLYRLILDYWLERNPKLRVIGYTATPYRVGLGMLTDGGMFTDIAYDITGREQFNRLIDEGYLCPLFPAATDTVLDITGVQKSANDYNQKQAQEAVDVAYITRAALLESLDRAWDRQHWLIFAQGVKHAENITNMLCMMGQNAACVHSKMSFDDVERRITAFKAGKLRMLVNADMLTTGFDYPGIDCIVMLRATMSTGLWVQMLGRGTRPVYAEGYWLEDMRQRLDAIAASDKQDCLVLDFADNTTRLGPINDPRIPVAKKKGVAREAGPPPLRLCEPGKVIVEDPETQPCRTWNFAGAKHCARCGAEFMVDPKLTEKASTAALIVKDEPQVVTFDVDRVVYQRWQKQGSPESIQVQYYCGMLRYSEWISFENEKVSKLARDWWRKRFNLAPNADCPPTAKIAEKYIDKARTPVKIRVHVNRQYPKILSHIFAEDLQNA
jgi:DNA repair protein RadD